MYSVAAALLKLPASATHKKVSSCGLYIISEPSLRVYTYKYIVPHSGAVGNIKREIDEFSHFLPLPCRLCQPGQPVSGKDKQRQNGDVIGKEKYERFLVIKEAELGAVE